MMISTTILAKIGGHRFYCVTFFLSPLPSLYSMLVMSTSRAEYVVGEYKKQAIGEVGRGQIVT